MNINKSDTVKKQTYEMIGVAQTIRYMILDMRYVRYVRYASRV